MTALRAVLVAATVVGLSGQEQPPAFFVSVDGVQVDVQVTRRGRPVAGLGREDFELRDNGVIQRIDSVTREEVPLDIFLVLDSSSSVAGERLEALAAAARIAVNTLAPPDRVALLTFSHRLSGAARLTSDRAAVLSAIDRLSTAGATSLLDALYAALVLRLPSPRRALILVFTDGHDNSSWLRPSDVVELAKQTDAVVYAVTLADPAERATVSLAPLRSNLEGLSALGIPSRLAEGASTPEFLRDVTTVSGGRLLDTAQPRRLRELFAQAVREMKTRYVLSYVPRGVARAGWHELKVTLTSRKADVTARRGYFVAVAADRR